MRKMVLRNPNDTSKEDANQFWLWFTTWISQEGIRLDIFKEDYIGNTENSFDSNLKYYNTQHVLYHGKEYPFFEIANKGINEEQIKEFIEIMYSEWVRDDRKDCFAIEVNKNLRKNNMDYQVKLIEKEEILAEPGRDIFDNEEFSNNPKDRRELLEDIFTILIQMQGDKLYRGVSENQLNDGIRNGLRITRRYQPFDQTRHGESASGLDAGELDILVSTKKEGLPIAIVEALILKSVDKKSLKTHIDKALVNYNPTGCKMTVIVIYSRAADFASLVTSLDGYLKTYEYPYDVNKGFEDIDTGFSESRHWKLNLVRSNTDILLHILAFNMP